LAIQPVTYRPVQAVRPITRRPDEDDAPKLARPRPKRGRTPDPGTGENLDTWA
jgi:hypothetical protein